MLFISGVRLSLATKSSRCISIVPSIAAVVTDGVKGYQWPQWRQFQRVRTSKLRETYQIGIDTKFSCPVVYHFSSFTDVKYELKYQKTVNLFIFLWKIEI